MGMIFDNTTSKCACPKDKPFLSLQGCIACFLPQYFNTHQKMCVYCPKNNIYDPTLQRCKKCPSSKPVFNGTTCSTCPNNTYFNSSINGCQNCTGGRYYNNTKKLC